MFSGIRYILGYNDESAQTDDAAGQSEPVSLTASSAAVLEKTLNAATTKFTEQLLPQQSSIEQLQSSSHQLLPSIKEQHEENSSHEQSASDAKLIETKSGESAPDDDDSFVADSWELLDLVEKPEDSSAGQLEGFTSVQKAEASPSGVCKSTSGILKSSGCVSDTSCQQSRQKPKVSFETSDLVRGKQEIEETKLNEALPAGLKKGKSNKNKRNSEAKEGERKKTIASAKLGKDAKKSRSDKIQKSEARENRASPCEVVGTEVTEANATLNVSAAKPIQLPTLNYAKALSTKPKTEEAKTVKKAEDGKEVDQAMTCKDANGGEGSRPMKRTRPTSTSSWSSSDEVETLQKDWVFEGESEVVARADKAKVDDDDDDKISLASSGFSDCDYGFGAIDDYVMRPKKASGRRNRTQSGSSGSVRGAKGTRGQSSNKGASSSAGASVAESEPKSVTCKTSVEKVSSDALVSTKNLRPKKKKLILTSSRKTTSSVDFLKPEVIENKLKGQFLEPVSLGKSHQSPVSSSNDSSEIPEMDESWYVTPPPCFTGANKQTSASKEEAQHQQQQQQPKSKEAARENALIEHPSIYIASSSKSVVTSSEAPSLKQVELPKKVLLKKVAAKKAAPEPVVESVLNKLEDAAWQSDDDDIFGDDPFERAEPIPGVPTEEPGPVKCAENSTSAEMKSKSIKKRTSGKKVAARLDKTNKVKAPAVIVKPIEKKAWKNKFIVDDWDLDEQEDLDSDFDSMFEPTRKKKSKGKKRQQNKVNKKNHQVVDDDSPLDVSLDSEDLSQESREIVVETCQDGSVELISIRSLSMENSIQAENERETFKEVVVADEKPKRTRQPIQVRPIEPERRPGWLLKKQRSKRRPLGSSSLDNKQEPSLGCSGSRKRKTSVKGKDNSPASSSSSSRSTPTLMDRISSSIVANFTNLTNGLVSSGVTLNSCSPVGYSSPLVEGSEKMQQGVATRPSLHQVAATQNDRRQLSRGSLKRQNITAQQANMQRRPDRRLKMFANPNGCSVNRKVHANIH